MPRPRWRCGHWRRAVGWTSTYRAPGGTSFGVFAAPPGQGCSSAPRQPCGSGEPARTRRPHGRHWTKWMSGSASPARPTIRSASLSTTERPLDRSRGDVADGDQDRGRNPQRGVSFRLQALHQGDDAEHDSQVPCQLAGRHRGHACDLMDDYEQQRPGGRPQARCAIEAGGPTRWLATACPIAAAVSAVVSRRSYRLCSHGSMIRARRPIRGRREPRRGRSAAVVPARVLGRVSRSGAASVAAGRVARGAVRGRSRRSRRPPAPTGRTPG